MTRSRSRTSKKFERRTRTRFRSRTKFRNIIGLRKEQVSGVELRGHRIRFEPKSYFPRIYLLRA